MKRPRLVRNKSAYGICPLLIGWWHSLSSGRNATTLEGALGWPPVECSRLFLESSSPIHSAWLVMQHVDAREGEITTNIHIACHTLVLPAASYQQYKHYAMGIQSGHHPAACSWCVEIQDCSSKSIGLNRMVPCSSSQPDINTACFLFVFGENRRGIKESPQLES